MGWVGNSSWMNSACFSRHLVLQNLRNINFLDFLDFRCSWCVLDGSWFMAQGPWLMAKGGRAALGPQGRGGIWPWAMSLPWPPLAMSHEPWAMSHEPSSMHPGPPNWICQTNAGGSGGLFRPLTLVNELWKNCFFMKNLFFDTTEPKKGSYRANKLKNITNCFVLHFFCFFDSLQSRGYLFRLQWRDLFLFGFAYRFNQVMNFV